MKVKTTVSTFAVVNATVISVCKNTANCHWFAIGVYELPLFFTPHSIICVCAMPVPHKLVYFGALLSARGGVHRYCGCNNASRHIYIYIYMYTYYLSSSSSSCSGSCCGCGRRRWRWLSSSSLVACCLFVPAACAAAAAAAGCLLLMTI